VTIDAGNNDIFLMAHPKFIVPHLPAKEGGIVLVLSRRVRLGSKKIMGFSYKNGHNNSWDLNDEFTGIH